MKYTSKHFSVTVGDSQAYRDNWDAVFGKKDPSPTPSKYKAVWQEYSRNEEFWREVLVGRTITDIEFDAGDRVSAVILDSGERVFFTVNHDKGVIGIKD